MTRLRSDLTYSAGALLVLAVALGAYKYERISQYEMWPEYAKWALEFVIVGAFMFFAGYTLAWARRENKGAKP
jgi:hypothetical protein